MATHRRTRDRAAATAMVAALLFQVLPPLASLSFATAASLPFPDAVICASHPAAADEETPAPGTIPSAACFFCCAVNAAAHPPQALQTFAVRYAAAPIAETATPFRTIGRIQHDAQPRAPPIFA